MQSRNKVLEDVLLRIKPKTSSIPEIDLMLEKIQKGIVKNAIKATVVIGGSFAKNVWNANDSDVDVFVRFEYETYKDAELSEHLETILKGLPAERVNGSRDYFKIKNKYVFEIIPVLAIKKKEDAKNIMDYSPLHTTWVNAQSKELKDDIRLAKQFARGCAVYGAESYRQGFSGHVIDILVIAHKGFLPLLKAAAGWKPKTIVDTENIYKGKALFYLNSSKTNGPLIVIDPIDSTRNAAAALSQESYDEFKRAAKAFLKKPSEEFFRVKEPPTQPGKNEILLKVDPISGKEDVRGAKLRKSFERLKREIADELPIKEAKWWWPKEGTATFLFTFKTRELPKTIEVKGPPATMKEHATLFKKQHPKAINKDGRLVSIEPHPYQSLGDLVKAKTEVLRGEHLFEKAVLVDTPKPKRTN